MVPSSVPAVPSNRFEAVKRNFASWDRNGDGFIDRSEIAKVLTMSGLRADDDAVTRMLNTMDDNRDGRISWEEFERRYLAKSARAHGATANAETTFMDTAAAHRTRMYQGGDDATLALAPAAVTPPAPSGTPPSL
jgi:hypothetical protein